LSLTAAIAPVARVHAEPAPSALEQAVHANVRIMHGGAIPGDNVPFRVFEHTNISAADILNGQELYHVNPSVVPAAPGYDGIARRTRVEAGDRIGDGWHGSGFTAEQAAPIVRPLRDARPGAGFTISMRVQWDGSDRGVLRALVDSYAAIGVEHLLVAPQDGNDWEKVTEGVGALKAGEPPALSDPGPGRGIRMTRRIALGRASANGLPRRWL
jgi:hypothetical protein